MKKKTTITAVITILLIYICCHLQFGREMDVVSSYSFSSADFLDERIKVSLNKIIITENKKDIAEDVIQRVLNNDFRTIKFNFDRGYPNRLEVSVYKNKKDIKSGNMFFSFVYEQTDGGETGDYDISQADYMRLDIDGG